MEKPKNVYARAGIAGGKGDTGRRGGQKGKIGTTVIA